MAPKATQQWMETVPIKELRPHPRNYRSHPEDQLEELMASLDENNQYRNVVIAWDNTILAGHGVVTVKRRYRRPQHHIIYDWQRFDTPLKLKEGVDLEKLQDQKNEYGMELKQVAEIKSKRIKELAKGYASGI